MKHSRGVEFQTETDDEDIEFADFRGDEPSGGEPKEILSTQTHKV